jgi:hypothetical protein
MRQMNRKDELYINHVLEDSFSSCSFNSEYSYEHNIEKKKIVDSSKNNNSNLQKRIAKLKNKNKKLVKKTHKKNKKIKKIRKKFLKRIRRARRYKNNSPSSNIQFTQLIALLCCPTMAIPYLLYKNMFKSKREYQKDDNDDDDDSDQTTTSNDVKKNNNSKHILVFNQDELFNNDKNNKTITSINWIDFIKFLILKFQIISYLPTTLGVNLPDKLKSFYNFLGLFTFTSIRYFQLV